MRFIVKTALEGRTVLRVEQVPVLDAYAKLHEALVSCVGADAAQFFAEPVVTWGNGEAPGSVSWYADADGDVRPLRSLPPALRAHHEEVVRDLLSRLLPLRADATLGPLLTRALVVADPESVLVVGQRVVLVNWGLLPAMASDTPASLAMQTKAMLGPYMPSAAAPSSMPPPVAPSPATPPSAGQLPFVPSAVPLSVPTGGAGWPASSDWNRWPLVAGLAIAVLCLALGLVLGARATQQQSAGASPILHVANADAIRDAIARRQAENTALEAQIEATHRTLSSNICVPDPVRIPSTVPPQTPVSPAMVAPPPAGSAPFHGTLVELLRQATVLVLAPQGSDLSLGSGFFIGPKLVATNRHVVEHAGPAGVLVVNTKLGRTLHANVRAETPDSKIYSPDVAVLEVPDAPPLQPLSFTRAVEQLDSVVAAGFPGVLLRTDDNFHRLLNGDTSAMPTVIMTDGRINAIQTASTGLPIVPHSAQISPGNSGGPLVDACGRVVGINTFINVSAEEGVHINYAEKADAVLAFLKSKQIDASESNTPCHLGDAASSGGPDTPALQLRQPSTPPATPASNQPAQASPAPPPVH